MPTTIAFFMLALWQSSTPPVAPDGPLIVTFDAQTRQESYVDSAWLPGKFPYPSSPITAGPTEGASRSFSADLVPVLTEDQYPASVNVRIEYLDPYGYPRLASGTMISPNHVITAAHVVHEGAGGYWNIGWRILPDWNGDSDTFGEAGVRSGSLPANWISFGNIGDDVAILILDRPLGFLTGWFFLSFAVDAFFQSSDLIVVGYPDQLSSYNGAPDQMYFGTGRADQIFSDLLISACGWSYNARGMDGAAMYHKDILNNRTVFGVHVLHYTTTDEIHAKRITQSDFSWLNGVISSSFSSTTAALVPLDVDATFAGTAALSGSTLSSMSYTVGNASYFDPGTITAQVDVYLSEDELIDPLVDTLIDSHSLVQDFAPFSTVVVNASPPTIPQTMQDGDYHLGVIVSAPGLPSFATEGWDAERISIDHCETTYSIIGQGLAGSGGIVPLLFGIDGGCSSGSHELHIAGGLGGAPGVLWVGLGAVDLFPVFGNGHFYVDVSAGGTTVPIRLGGTAGVPGAGTLDVLGGNVARFAPLTIYVQCGLADLGAPAGISLTNGLSVQIN